MRRDPPSLTKHQPIGATLQPHGGAQFRVWAPDHTSVGLIVEDSEGRSLAEHPLSPQENGYFGGVVPGIGPGELYRYRLGTSGERYPDPASRYQPLGPHGPSQIVDPTSFVWTDTGWAGLTIENQVLYEMHVGTFTPEGTWSAAAGRFPALRDIGITTIEMMPVAEFAGTRGWGYDGVALFAPTHLYGSPDDLRHFVDRAHGHGLGVILDVVYNHLGPDGNFLGKFTGRYFSSRYDNEWGDAINFDDDAAAVREFMAANAAYWIEEFHFDGLRLDATQQIFDASTPHIVAEIAARARDAAGRRTIIVVAENEPQDARLVRDRREGGFELDALWNEDFHHNAVVALTGRREGYYTDYGGTSQEFLSLAKWGFLYQGQRYSWQKARRGTPTRGLAPFRLITFLENHDQVANGPDGRGTRLLLQSSPGVYRAVTAAWLLSPGTPMFFQGQEYGAETPFLYFADHQDALGTAVREGRAEFMSQFRSPASRNLLDALPDPGAAETFTRCALSHDAPRPEVVALHRDLLALRRHDPLIRPDARCVLDGAVLSSQAFVLRWFADDPRLEAPSSSDEHDRLLIVNLGAGLHFNPAPEPLLAPETGRRWSLLWSSEDPAYGGQGTAPLDTDDNWIVPGQSAVLLSSVPQ